MEAVLAPAISRGGGGELVFTIARVFWMPSRVSCSASPSPPRAARFPAHPLCSVYIYMYV